MSDRKKAGQFDLALNLLIACKSHIEKEYSGTPGRTELLDRIRMFEELLTADFS